MDFELSDEAAKGAAPSWGIWLRRLSPRVPMGPAQLPCSLLGKAGLTGLVRVLGLSAAGASPERPFIKYQDIYGWSHQWTSVTVSLCLEQPTVGAGCEMGHVAGRLVWALQEAVPRWGLGAGLCLVWELVWGLG